MDTGETVSFTCDRNAIGSALKITIKDRREFLMLCEVLVFGKGTTYSNLHLRCCCCCSPLGIPDVRGLRFNRPFLPLLLPYIPSVVLNSLKFSESTVHKFFQKF